MPHLWHLKIAKKVHTVEELKCTLSFPIFFPLADSTSVATEYSLKFDESMTEDEIEERSFRSLLPSEAHRRGTKEKKSHHHEESEDDGSNHNMTSVSGAHSILKVRWQCSHVNLEAGKFASTYPYECLANDGRQV